MTDVARLFIILGVVFILFGGLLFLFGKFPGFGRLPGDIFIKKDNFTFYFPLASCILLSILISLVMMWFNRR